MPTEIWICIQAACNTEDCTMPTEIWISIQLACNTEDCTMPTEIWICIKAACNTEDCTMPTEIWICIQAACNTEAGQDSDFNQVVALMLVIINIWSSKLFPSGFWSVPYVIQSLNIGLGKLVDLEYVSATT